jgi:hypothetical protein
MRLKNILNYSISSPSYNIWDFFLVKIPIFVDDGLIFHNFVLTNMIR